jgi:hypothetical protein
MTLTIEIKPEVEAALAARAESQGVDVASYAASLVEEAVAPDLPRPKRSPEEVRAWLDRIAKYSDRIPDMPGETFSREMIYRDHD